MIGFLLKIYSTANLAAINSSIKQDTLIKEYFNSREFQSFEEFKSSNFLLYQNRRLGDYFKPFESSEYFISMHGNAILEGHNDTTSICKAIAQILTTRNIEKLSTYLDGSFCIYIFDKRANKHHIITDKAGFTPVYFFSNHDHVIISSHPDAMSIFLDYSLSLNLISIAEFLYSGRIEYPSTYYKEVSQLAPGTNYVFEDKLYSCSYWEPVSNFSWLKDDLINSLAESIQQSVQKATHPHLGSHGIFLSGGADSRAILFSRNKDSHVVASTFYDEPNNEYYTAKALAHRAGVEHIGLQREFEHYGNTAKLYVKVTQGMMGLSDSHYISFLSEIQDLNIDNWHTGCFADWFFKGIAFNTTYHKFLGKPLPTWQTFDQFHPIFHTYSCSISAEYQKHVNNIVSVRYPEKLVKNSLSTDSLWEIEKLRLWPINREFTFGTRMSLSAFFNWSPILSQNAMLNMWTMIPPEYKLNGVIWKSAVAKICKGNNDIKDNNWGTNLNYSPALNSALFIIESFKRKLQKSTLSKIATTGSWPNFKYYVSHSQVLEEIWNEGQDVSGPILSQILGINPFAHTSKEWGEKDVLLFTRMVSIHIWLNLVEKKFNTI